MNIAIFGQPGDKKANRNRVKVFEQKKQEQLNLFGVTASAQEITESQKSKFLSKVRKMKVFKKDK